MLPPNLFLWLRLAGALALILALAGAYAYWHRLKAEAALVPQLSSRIASDDARANALATRLAQVEQARAASDRALARWQAAKSLALQSLEKEGQHASAHTNPVCFPTPAERGLRNAALGRLAGFGEAGSAASVPEGPGSAD
jgi:hypothetical protein